MKKCKIDLDNTGNVVVLGENASLYNSALIRFENEVDALSVYSVSLTESFKNTGVEPTLDNVVNFINQRNISVSNDFTNSELRDIYNTDFSNFLSATTIGNEFALNRENMRSFYTEQEIDNIFSDYGLQDSVKRLWSKFQNNIESLEQYDFPNTIISIPTQETTSLGKNRVENPDKIYNDLGRAISGMIQTQDLQDVLEGELQIIATQDSETEQAIIEEFQGKQAIPQYVINPETNTLEKKVYGNIYYRLLQTFDTNQDFSPVLDEIAFLNTIDIDVLNYNKDAFQDIIARIEQSSVDIGIDMNMLSDVSQISPIEQTLELLNSYTDFLINNNVQGFSEQYNTYFNTQDFSRPDILEIQGENLLKLDNPNTLTEAELFVEYNIIRVKDNIYQKVNTDTLDIYEDVYNRVVQNPDIFPPEVYEPYTLGNKRYKADIKQNIQDYVQTLVKDYQTPNNIPTDILEQLVVYKQVFGQPDTVIEKEFYNNDLQNKNNSEFVDKFLIKMNKLAIKQNIPIAFTQNGIELPYEGLYSALELKNSVSDNMWNDILNYAKITNLIPSALLLSGEQYNPGLLNKDFDRNFYTNFKTQLPVYNNMFEQKDDKIYTDSNEDFIRVKGQIYESIEKGIYRLVENQNTLTWDRIEPTSVVPQQKTDIRPQDDKTIQNKKQTCLSVR